MAQVSYPCLKVVAPRSMEEDLPWDLHDMGATSVEVRDDTTMTPSTGGAILIMAGFADAPARDEALRAISTSGQPLEATPVDVVDDGWSGGWKSFFKPVVLDRLQIITPWMAPPRDDRLTLVVDPGLAFGTGGHATTRLILGMLERRASDGELPGALLDVGAGSGILAIAAVMLGAREVLGIDIDAESVEAMTMNAATNGVGDRVEAREAVPSDLEGSWPLVLANIELGVFRGCAAAIASLVAPGGEALLSGLLEEQVEECLALWPGFEVLETPVLEGWAALSLRRKQ